MSKGSARFSARTLAAGLILALLALTSGMAGAQTRDMAASITQVAKLTAADGATLDGFGYAVAVSGETAVVGASGDDGHGSAYLFERNAGGPNNWGQVAKLTASDSAAMDYFGLAVSISGDTVVVGAYGDDDHGDRSGAAYVFEKPGAGWTNMTETGKLTALDATDGDWFGASVSIEGGTLVVGAFRHEGGGAAYVFERDAAEPGQWGQVAKLTASDGALILWFGRSVAISGNTVVVGARADAEHGGQLSGSAYLFVQPEAGWTDTIETAKLTATDGVLLDQFAEHVAISGDTVLVSAAGDDENGSSAGAAYLFVEPETGWANMTGTAKLTAADSGADDDFGASVSISDDMAIVGVTGDDVRGESSGSAYLFEKPEAGWIDIVGTTRIVASDGATGDYFGRGVSIGGSNMIVGADGDDDKGEDSGSAYVFFAFRPIAWVYLPIVLRNAP